MSWVHSASILNQLAYFSKGLPNQTTNHLYITSKLLRIPDTHKVVCGERNVLQHLHLQLLSRKPRHICVPTDWLLLPESNTKLSWHWPKQDKKTKLVQMEISLNQNHCTEKQAAICLHLVWSNVMTRASISIKKQIQGAFNRKFSWCHQFGNSSLLSASLPAVPLFRIHTFYVSGGYIHTMFSIWEQNDPTPECQRE